VSDLEFIQKAQQLEFSLNEIRELFRDPPADAARSGRVCRGTIATHWQRLLFPLLAEKDRVRPSQAVPLKCL
jgi:hypothetical protein